MKKCIFSIVFVAIFMAISVCGSVVIDAKEYQPVDFETLYGDFAKVIEESNDNVDAMMMTDLNRDSIPELFTLSSCGVEEWEKNSLLFERGYYISADKNRYGGEFAGISVNDCVVESSPWRDENDTVPIKNRMTINKLRDDPFDLPTETFISTSTRVDGIECLTMYDIDTVKQAEYNNLAYCLSSIWLEEDGFDYKLEEFTHEYFNEYSGSNAVMVSVRLRNVESGERISVKQAMEILVDAFVEAEKSRIISSDWAKDELYEAKREGIISAEMLKWDMTKKITRAEFAALIACADTRQGKKGEQYLSDVNIKDIDESEYKSEIQYAFSKGYVNGTLLDEQKKEAFFSPDLEITREQIATMLFRIFDDSVLMLPYDNVENFHIPFSDADEISDYAKIAVYVMHEEKVLKGEQKIYSYDSTKDSELKINCFYPKRNMTRQEAVVAVNRLYKIIDIKH